jgi:4-amino-4-deoxy-L-arabinose transferase-like glycosyltransferase
VLWHNLAMAPSGTAETSSPARRSYLPLLVVSLVVIFVAAVRYRMLSVPLDRDEGEYAYSAQLILRGLPPWVYSYSMKLPGTACMYALFLLLFGQTREGIHLGFLLTNAASIFLMFGLGRKLSGAFAGVAAAAAFALLTLDKGVLGFHAEATHFVVFFAICGLLLLLSAIEDRRSKLFFFSGLAFGLAALMKQHGLVFSAFGLLYIAWAGWHEGWPRRACLSRLTWMAAGVGAPFAVLCLTVALKGGFGLFQFWTFTYAHRYVSELTWRDGLTNLNGYFLQSVAVWSVALWLTALGALLLLVVHQTGRKYLSFLLPLLLFSFAGTLPGYYLREHYFVLVLPAVALMIGVGLHLAHEWARQHLSGLARFSAVWVLLAILGSTIYRERAFFFLYSPRNEWFVQFFPNPFGPAVAVSQFLRANSRADDRIAVLGSEPEIYFYSQRRSASGYIYMYGLMEKQELARQMQHQFMGQMEDAKPQFVVLVRVYYSWLVGPQSIPDLKQWIPVFLAQYHVVGLANLNPDGHTDYYWNEAALKAQPADPCLIIFERN